MFSQSEAVIGKDLKFAGRDVKFVSQGKVKVDCEFEGDVTGTEVVISERGEVRGKVVGELLALLRPATERSVGQLCGTSRTLRTRAQFGCFVG